MAYDYDPARHVIDTSKLHWHWCPDPTFRIKRVECRTPRVMRGKPPREGLYRRLPVVPDYTLSLTLTDPLSEWGPTFQTRTQIAREHFTTTWCQLGVGRDAIEDVRVEIGYYRVESTWVWTDE